MMDALWVILGIGAAVLLYRIAGFDLAGAAIKAMPSLNPVVVVIGLSALLAIALAVPGLAFLKAVRLKKWANSLRGRLSEAAVAADREDTEEADAAALEIIELSKQMKSLKIAGNIFAAHKRLLFFEQETRRIERAIALSKVKKEKEAEKLV